MSRDLYDVAREICHKFGFNWTDPRTRITHKAPRKRKVGRPPKQKSKEHSKAPVR